MTDQEIKEFNDFVGTNPIRNKFLPIVHHLSKLTNQDLDIQEYSKDDETSSITFKIETNKFKIEGKVGYG